MRYLHSRAISGLFIEKFNIEDLLREYSIILIWAAKSVDLKVIKVKILRYWYRLEIHRMSLVLSWKKKNGITMPKNQIIYKDKIENTTLIIDKQSTTWRMFYS